MEHYISQQKNQLLDSLENQVRFSQLVAIVVGDKGVGKSFLLMELQSRLEQEVLTARVDASLAMTEEQLEKTISLQLGLSWQDSETPLEQRIKNDLGQKVLIAIDDAHRLSSSCLNFILMLNQNQLEFRESVIFILLAGDNSLPALIKQTDTYSLHQDMCVVFQVEPVERNETQPLIAAMDPDPLISVQGLYKQKKLDYFWQLSKGNPAELNYHVSRWIAEHSSPQPSEILAEQPTSYLRSFLYLLVAITLMSVLIFQDELNQFISSSNSSQENGVSIAGTDKKIEILRETHDGKKSGSQKPKTTLDDPIVQQGISKKEQANSDSYESNDGSKSIEYTSAESIHDIVEDVNPTANIIDTSAETRVNKVDSGSEQLSQESKASADSDDKEKQQAMTAEMTYLTEDEQELLLLADNHYLLQWLALSGKDAADQYVEKHQLKATLKIYRRAQSGSALFLIVSGDFASREAAQATLAGFKSSGIAEKPWVKSIKAVQNEIKAFQNSNN